MTSDHDPASGSLASPSGNVVDPLSDVLSAVRLTGALFFIVDATSPWCVDIPDTDHYASPPEFDFDEALFFFGEMAAGRLPFTVKEGGGEQPPARFICGFLGCDMQPFNPLLVNLPRVLKIGRRTDDTDRLDQLIEMTMTEMQSNSAGSIAMRLRFSELLFVELLQRYLQQPESGHYGWMSGLRDPVTSRALALLHSDTAKDWTLEVLVREAGASRSVLAERFQRLIGQGPIQYLTCWRMQLAAQMLLKADTKVSAIAFNVGYASVAAFSRAFKKVTGFSPSEWREREKSDAG